MHPVRDACPGGPREYEFVSVSAGQSDAFYAEVVREGKVWAIRDEGGVPAPLNADGQRSMPFWSLRSRAERITSSVEAYAGMDVFEIALDEWRERWLPGLDRDGLLVGLNWTGARATGFDVSPSDVERNLATRRAI